MSLGAVQDALAEAVRRLDMDVAVLGEVRDGLERCVAVAGDADRFGLVPGVSLPTGDTYCERLLTGRLDNVVRDVQQLTFLHLRFHGYGRGEWTNSAVRRYVVDAGPLLGRLHKLVRSDCTTRNERRARALSATYDALEKRIADIKEREDLDAVRPDLDGNEIIRLLRLAPGPLVGRAWQHLKAVRLERGQLSRAEAEAELRRWADENLPPG
jgi:hypothetical protein